jgi:hypothetical protein
MKRCLGLIVIALLWGPFSVLGQSSEFSDSRLAVIDDPLRVELQGGAGAPTQEKIRQVIAIVAPSRDWKVVSESDGRFELTRTVSGKHTMRVELTYDQSGYDIRYLESINLLYNEQERSMRGRNLRAIHKNYNVWIRELVSSINAALGVPATASVGARPATPLPKNTKVVAPAADAPAAVAAYSGAWAGTWKGGRAHTLVVERIEGRSVSFIYSFDPAETRNSAARGWRRVEGNIGDDGVLRATMEGSGGTAKVSYKLSADRSKLLGEYSANGRTRTGTFARHSLPASIAAETKN